MSRVSDAAYLPESASDWYESREQHRALRTYADQVVLLPTVGRERDLAENVLELLDEVERLRALVTRAEYVALHLHSMIDGETWRASGGDDGQGPRVRGDPVNAARDPRGVGNGPVAGRFVLLHAEDDTDAPDWGYVTSWDEWSECEVAFPIAPGFKLHDDETGREWVAGSPYEWEAART